jgi:hypothetical protein
LGELLIRAAWATAAVLLFVGCGGDNGGGATTDLAMGKDMAVFSVCGHPGDTGNSVGVGKYCVSPVTDCQNNGKATLCSSLGSDNSFFCTFPCTASDMGNECGENASCQCGSGSSQSGCGCFPDRCK